MKKYIVLLFLAVYLFLNQANSQVIPEDRRIKWQPGIPGGIPSTEAPVENVIDHGADPIGEKDSHGAFIAAINKLPEKGGIVYIPEGTFLLKSTIHLYRNNIILRGAGINKTKLLSEADGISIRIGPGKSGNWQKIFDGHNLGSSRIEVQDGSAFTGRQFIEIQQENDSSIMYTSDTWKQRWAENSVGQVLEVESIRGNTINLKTALHITFSVELNPVVRPVDPVKNVGIENLYIRKIQQSNHTIHFEHTAYCWMKNVESYMTKRSHVRMSASLRNEIRECFFHNSYDYGGGGHGYGVECANHTSDVLVENNVFDSLRHAMMVQTGANGNVYAYNYSANPIQGAPDEELNTGWIPPDISVHGHYPYMNLFEGNDVMEIGISDYWGPAGPGNTYLRNRVRGEGIICYDHSHEQNLLANKTTYFINTNNSCLRLLKHGNMIEGKVIWNPSVSDQYIPVSLYLKSKPVFFEGNTWPPFGPDVESDTELPAQNAYKKFLKRIK